MTDSSAGASGGFMVLLYLSTAYEFCFCTVYGCVCICMVANNIAVPVVEL